MVSRNKLPYSLRNGSEWTEYVTMMCDPGHLEHGWVVDNPRTAGEENGKSPKAFLKNLVDNAAVMQ